MTTTVSGLAGISELAGSDLGCTDWLEITAHRADAFAHATDGEPTNHADEGESQAGPFGGPIADGCHTLSLVGSLFDRLLRIDGITMTVIYGMNKVRLPSPVLVGAKVRLHATIVEVAEVNSDSVQMVVDCTVEIEGVQKPACVAQMVYRTYA